MHLGALKGIARTALPNAAQHAAQRWLCKRNHGVTGPRGLPAAPCANAVLQNKAQVAASMVQLRTLGLPPVEDTPKNRTASRHSISCFETTGARHAFSMPAASATR